MFIGQTDAYFSIFQDGGRRHLGFSTFKIVMVGKFKRAKLRHCAKVRADQTVAEVMTIF